MFHSIVGIEAKRIDKERLLVHTFVVDYTYFLDRHVQAEEIIDEIDDKVPKNLVNSSAFKTIIVKANDY